jgi:hypothetical protein
MDDIRNIHQIEQLVQQYYAPHPTVVVDFTQRKTIGLQTHILKEGKKRHFLDSDCLPCV